ncbi:MAG TPA: hypothetical protein VHL53_05775 [Acidimicrobiia bacterium]|nr:hypothetical protein [Acidimicrobiia bacterium]
MQYGERPGRPEHGDNVPAQQRSIKKGRGEQVDRLETIGIARTV